MASMHNAKGLFDLSLQYQPYEKEKTIMNGNRFDLALPEQYGTGFIAQLTTAIFNPILVKGKMDAQKEILMKALENKQEAMTQIMNTIQKLSNNGDLSSERFTTLMTLYMQIYSSN